MDISSLLSSLSEEDIGKLKATAQQFFGGAGGNNDASADTQGKGSSGVNPSMLPGLPFDPAMLSGVAKISQMMNENDERCAFIAALKPLLSESRRKKADDAVMMLRFMKILGMMQENGR